MTSRHGGARISLLAGLSLGLVVGCSGGDDEGTGGTGGNGGSGDTDVASGDAITSGDPFFGDTSGPQGDSAGGDTAVAAGDDGGVVTLQNDEWADGTTLGCQGGFGVGESYGALFGPVVGTVDLRGVLLAFCGDTSTVSSVMHVHADDAGGSEPGTELGNANVSLTGTDSALNYVDLSGQALSITDTSFWITFDVQHAGFPGPAIDTDGVTAGRNVLLPSGGGWVDSGTLGLSGDWIIRVETVPQ